MKVRVIWSHSPAIFQRLHTEKTHANEAPKGGSFYFYKLYSSSEEMPGISRRVYEISILLVIVNRRPLSPPDHLGVFPGTLRVLEAVSRSVTRSRSQEPLPVSHGFQRPIQ